MKFTALFLLISNQVCNANILLVPGPEIRFENYSRKCANSEFLCTTDYFLSLLISHGTPQFDKLMDSVDLSSEKFRDEFRNKIVNILNTEELNRPQLAMLLKLIQQINTIKPTLILKMIENELQRIQAVIDRNLQIGKKPEKNEFIFIFREILPMQDAGKIRTTFLKIPLYVIHYSSIPYKTNTFDFKRVIKKPLLSGLCGNNALNYKIKSVKFCNKRSRDLSEATDFIIKERRY